MHHLLVVADGGAHPKCKELVLHDLIACGDFDAACDGGPSPLPITILHSCAAARTPGLQLRMSSPKRLQAWIAAQGRGVGRSFSGDFERQSKGASECTKVALQTPPRRAASPRSPGLESLSATSLLSWWTSGLDCDAGPQNWKALQWRLGEIV